ncbi:MAG: hypothetical protein HRT61_05365 [Ekhidna sp.]|nr:hypothetical protein [Ekhidna sp.]
MIKSRWLNSYTKEERYAMVALMIALLFFPINILFNEQLIFKVVQAILIAFCSGFLYFLIKRKYQKKVILFFCLLMLGSFVGLLPYSSGYQGGMGYAFQLLSTAILLLTVGRTKLLFSILLIVLVIYMPIENIDYSQVQRDPHFDYFIIPLFLSVALFFFKRNLDLEERTLRTNNDKLEKLNARLEAQENLLVRNQQKIEEKRNHLQADVIERTKKLEEKNKRLLEFSFINAHLVRAPIANIIALVEMKTDDENIDMYELKDNIHKMDEVIRKIANVLS